MSCEFKRCGRCETTKPLDAFYLFKGKPTLPCKDCRKKQVKEWSTAKRQRVSQNSARWQKANPENRKAIKVRKKARQQVMVRELKGSTPCKDCGRNLPYWVMHFDHRPGEVKVLEVSLLAKQFTGDSKILREIAKCDIVCANCHADRTQLRSESA